MGSAGVLRAAIFEMLFGRGTYFVASVGMETELCGPGWAIIQGHPDVFAGASRGCGCSGGAAMRRGS